MCFLRALFGKPFIPLDQLRSFPQPLPYNDNQENDPNTEQKVTSDSEEHDSQADILEEEIDHLNEKLQNYLHKPRLGFIYPTNETPALLYVGKMEHECKHCQSLNFIFEWVQSRRGGHYRTCCQGGKVQLPQVEIPQALQLLMEGDTEDSKNFREHIRQFNASFAFASVKDNQVPPPGFGPYCYRIHGTIHHMVASLRPSNEFKPSYASLYLLDAAEANALRQTHAANKDLSPSVFIILNEILQR